MRVVAVTLFAITLYTGPERGREFSGVVPILFFECPLGRRPFVAINWWRSNQGGLGAFGMLTAAKLPMLDAKNEELRPKLSGGGTAIGLLADDLWDGVTVVESTSGALQRVVIVFDEETAHGWCQAPSEEQNDDIRVFWVEKQR